jgi:hypothetical protein
MFCTQKNRFIFCVFLSAYFVITVNNKNLIGNVVVVIAEAAAIIVVVVVVVD